MDCREYLDVVAAHVDGQLGAAELTEAEKHVASCARCQAAKRAQAFAKASLRSPSLQHSAPAQVADRIKHALDLAATDPSEQATKKPSTMRRALLVGAIAAGLALVLIPLRLLQTPDLIGALVQDVRAANAQEIALDVTSSDLDVLRTYYREARHMPFEDTVGDLSGFGMRPLGATARDLNGVKATFTLYEMDDGKVLCRRFRVGDISMPPGGEPFKSGRLYTTDGVTIWIHQAGDATCCLVTTIPRDEFVAELGGATASYGADSVPRG